MLLFHLGFATLLACSYVLGQNQSSSADLRLGPISFAGYTNYVYRDNITNLQIVTSRNTSTVDSRPARFLLAFPRGNSGICSFFSPLNGTLAITADNTTFKSISQENNQTGFSTELKLSADVELGPTFIGSVRTIRDYVEANGTRNEIFNWTLGSYNSSSVELVRHWINGTTVQYLTYSAVDNVNISTTPNQNATLPPDVLMTRPDQSRNATLLVTTTFNFTNTTDLIGLGAPELFLNSSSSINNNSQLLPTVIDAIQGEGQSIANQTAFLSYTDVFFAGGWRFLTYFGRDTLISLRLLLPVLTAEASEGILKAVLQRTRIDEPTGELTHEETIGDYSSWINIQNNQSYLGDTPSYNYVMLDTDFLALPVLADYLLSTPQGQGRSSFLAEQSTLNPGTLQSLLELNVNHVLNLTRPFAENPTADNLLRIRDALVGNWRDSGSGLGYGKVPFDVNTALVPAALRAIAALSDAGVLPSNYSSTAASYASTWEGQSYQFFEVPIDSSTANSRLQAYLQQAGLPASTLQGGGVLNQTASSSGLYGNASETVGGSGNSTFFALSLLENNTAVEVLNSDLAFVLEYSSNVSSSIIRATIEALQPYPRGLLTNVGMVVANAAYDSNTTAVTAGTFDNAQYHGAVVWSWQQGLMAQGIGRQLSLCGLSNTTLVAPPVNTTRPTWCSDESLTSGLLAAQTRLWDSIAGSTSVLYTEVWSPVYANGTFTIGDLGAISPTGTEGDAIQLWSYGFLGLVDPRTGKPVASGI